MYIRLSFLYQRADKMTKGLSARPHKAASPSAEGAVEQPLTYLISKLCSLKKKKKISPDEQNLNGHKECRGSIPFTGEMRGQRHPSSPLRLRPPRDD